MKIGDLLDENMRCTNCGGTAEIVQKTIPSEKNDRGFSNITIKYFTKCCGIELIIPQLKKGE
jgi:hypothetical protein